MAATRGRDCDTVEDDLKAAHTAAFRRRTTVREAIPIEQRVGSAIRRHRLASKLTLQGLAQGAGLSAAMLSRLENGQTSVSLEALERLCIALGVPLSSLLKDVDAPDGTAQLLKCADQIEVIRTGTKHGHSYRLLAHPNGAMPPFEPFVIDMRKNSEIYPRFQHGGTEFIYMIFGSMRYRFGTEIFLLEPGDALTFLANVVHEPEELIDDDIRFLSIMLADSPRWTSCDVAAPAQNVGR